MLGGAKSAFMLLEPDAAGRCIPEDERRDIIVGGEGVQDDHLHRGRVRAPRRDDGGCWRTGPEKIAVSWAPVFGPSRLLRAVFGHPGCVDRRLLLSPDGRVAGTQKELAQVPGYWQERAGHQAGCDDSRCEGNGLVCTYAIECTRAHTHTHTHKVNSGSRVVRLRPMTAPN